MQAIFGGTWLLRFWTLLQHEEMAKELLLKESTTLEVVALEFFTNYGCKHVSKFF